MSQCLFCKIIEGKIPSEKVFENDTVLAFRDINPVAPIHLLFIHKEHSHDICDLMDKDETMLVEVMKAITSYAKEEKINKKGFRIINNMGRDGGQSVFHTHFHVLAGTELSWP